MVIQHKNQFHLPSYANTFGGYVLYLIITFYFVFLSYVASIMFTTMAPLSMPPNMLHEKLKQHKTNATGSSPYIFI
jgi:hypothetical protein